MKKLVTAGLVAALLVTSSVAFAGTGSKRVDPGRTALPSSSSQR